MPKLWQQAIGAMLAVLLTVLVPLSSTYADTKPYFRTQNSGPFVGGWFKDSGGSCESSYQRPSFSTPTSVNNIYRGAVMAWANSDRNRSSGSSLDAFATGVIEGSGGSEYGFYTGLPGSNGPLSFANFESFGNLNNPPFWGGIFEGADLGDAHCIPDYYSEKGISLDGDWTRGNYSTSGKFAWTPDGFPMPGGTIPPGTRLTIFVNSDVHIRNNITYDPGYNITNVPKFAVVVRGHSLTIHPDVDRLDGWYILQPTAEASTGGAYFYTCNDTTTLINDNFIRTNCGRNPLVVNGAITTRQINLGRIGGGLGSSASETINFSPEMVLGGPFFEDENTTDTTGAIQSLVTLPPVF